MNSEYQSFHIRVHFHTAARHSNMITDTVVIEESFLANMTLQKDTGFFLRILLKNSFEKSLKMKLSYTGSL